MQDAHRGLLKRSPIALFAVAKLPFRLALSIMRSISRWRCCAASISSRRFSSVTSVARTVTTADSSPSSSARHTAAPPKQRELHADRASAQGNIRIHPLPIAQREPFRFHLHCSAGSDAACRSETRDKNHSAVRLPRGARNPQRHWPEPQVSFRHLDHVALSSWRFPPENAVVTIAVDFTAGTAKPHALTRTRRCGLERLSAVQAEASFTPPR